MAELTDDTHADTIREASAALADFAEEAIGSVRADDWRADIIGATDAIVAERDHARAALRRAREDFIIVRDEMEVSTQEAFVDAAITRIDAVLTENAYPNG